jgi:thiol-disulfide isomerase/thioredoxin
MNTLPVDPASRRNFLRHIALLGGSALLPSAAFAAAKAGDRLPDLAKAGLEGTVPDIRGKVVHLDFWASWCVPCKESFPILEALHKEYSPRGYVLIGVSVDEEKAEMDRFLKQHPVSFPIVRDAAEKLAFQLRPPGMPTSFFAGPGGVIHSVHPKFEGEATRKAYVAIIEDLLKQVKS